MKDIRAIQRKFPAPGASPPVLGRSDINKYQRQEQTTWTIKAKSPR
jgi:hypothetical protein